jgi:hypothetical protein
LTMYGTSILRFDLIFVGIRRIDIWLVRED